MTICGHFCFKTVIFDLKSEIPNFVFFSTSDHRLEVAFSTISDHAGWTPMVNSIPRNKILLSRALWLPHLIEYFQKNWGHNQTRGRSSPNPKVLLIEQEWNFSFQPMQEHRLFWFHKCCWFFIGQPIRRVFNMKTRLTVISPPRWRSVTDTEKGFQINANSKVTSQ